MTKKKPANRDIAEVARDHLGFESLRPGQKEAVTAILDGHDTLVVQPTGSGKSAIYRIAGILIQGSTVIVSPLIALQKDQVDSIAEQSPADALALNSTLPISDFRERVEKIEQGQIEYIFLSPEQLHKSEVIENLKSANISLFVVDEAHCISEWGHDFRPDYLRLGQVIESLGHPKVLALTATATRKVREEIIERLRMRRPKLIIQGFDRPNIHLRVDHFKTEAEKLEEIIHRTRWAEKPGIIYTATRNSAEEIMRALAAEQIDALFYHGGMKAKDRHDVQERFMSGEAEVIVATNAFGMGVDKPDVRFVYHFDVSDSLDSYYQEIGRGGRDGKKTEAVLFYRHENIGAQSFKTSNGKVDTELVRNLVTQLSEKDTAVDPEDVADDLGISKRKLTSTLQRLEDAGAIEILNSGEVQAVEEADPAEAADSVAEDQEKRQEGNRERLEKMREYAETTSCRRELLLQYLGDSFQGPCNNCDNCEAAAGIGRVDPNVGTRREVGT